MNSSPRRSSTTAPAGVQPRGQNESSSAVVCKAGASIACCGVYPPDERAQQLRAAATGPAGRRRACPSAMTGTPSRSTSVGVRVVRGRRPGRSADGELGPARSSAAGCRGRSPAPGSSGEDCSQPPDGVAETMLPQRSTTSMWQVSPRVAPSVSTVGSPVPAAGATTARAGSERQVRDVPVERTRSGRPGRPLPDQSAAPGGDQGATASSPRRRPEARRRRRPVAVLGVAVGERQLQRLEDGVRARAVDGSRSAVRRCRGCPGSAAGRGPWAQAPALATV